MILKVQVLEGKGFGPEPQALLCCASFAGEPKATQYSVATSEHIWQSTLTWSISREQLRSATSNTNHCKISVLRKDGTSLGWVVVSLRSAKLQGQYRSDPQGQWLQLNASKLPDPPQLRVTYSLLDERHTLSQQRQSPIIVPHSNSSSSLSSETSTGGGSTSSRPEGDAIGPPDSKASSGTAATAIAKLSQGRHSAAALRPSRAAKAAVNQASVVAVETSRMSNSSSSNDDGGDGDPGSCQEVEQPPDSAFLSAAAAATDAGPLSVVAAAAELDAEIAVLASDALGGPVVHADDHQAQLADPVSASGADRLDSIILTAGSGLVEDEGCLLPQEQQRQQNDQQQQQQAGNVPANTIMCGPGGLAAATRQAADEVQTPPSAECEAEQANTSCSCNSTSSVAAKVETAVASNLIDAMAAAEASLPTFAERRQQQQQQQQRGLLQCGIAEQQQQQAATDTGPEQGFAMLHPAVQPLAPTPARMVDAAPTDSKQPTAHTPPGLQGAAADAAPPAAAPGVLLATDMPAVTPAAPADADSGYAAGCPAAGNPAGTSAQTTAAPAAGQADEVEAGAASTLAAALAAGAEVEAVPPPAAASALSTHAVSEPFQSLVDPTRDFLLTLDVRSFHAGRRLPVAIGSIYVTAWLPQELLGFLSTQCGAKVPPRLTPLRTKPAVDIARGSEGALPSGTASVGFDGGVMALAGLLAAEPRVTLEVWHKERLRSDLLLGVASISLSALLQECWVDGYAPVYAIMTKASAAGSSASSSSSWRQQQQDGEEKVQVGLLRVVMSLEDRGPAAAAPADKASAPLTSVNKAAGPDLATAAAAVAAAPEAKAGVQASQARQQPVSHQPLLQQEQQPAGLPAVAVSAIPGPTGLPDDVAPGVTAAAAESLSGDFRQMPEYLVAWELELWKKAEEARFRAQLQELEQQRMGVIEAAWRTREAQRQADIAATKAKYAALEQQTRELLLATQERERVLLAAEADLRLRRSELEREAAARTSEAEAAVRRLQVECEHQLGLERDRTAAVIKQRDAAEARTAALEAQFTEYVASQHNAPEAKLKAELAEAQQVAKAAAAKLEATQKLNKKYKQQVHQLARELAVLHQQQQQEALQQQRLQLEAALAREQSSLAAAHKAELASLKEQLQKLRAVALQQAWPGLAGVQAMGAAASPSGRSRPGNRQQRKQQRHHKERHADKENQENQEWIDAPNQRHRTAQSLRQQQLHDHGSSDDRSDRSDSDNNSSDGSRSGDESGNSSAADSMCRQNTSSHRRACEGVDATEVTTLAAILNQRRSPHKVRQAAAAAACAALTGEVATSGGGGGGLTQPPSFAAAASAAASIHAAAGVADDSQQLLQQQQPAALQAEAAGACSKQPGPECIRGPNAGGSDSSNSPLSEVRRLLKEKVDLLATGLYARDDAVILQIDARVQALAEKAAAQ